MEGRRMATKEDWILDTIADIRRAFNAVLATAEDLYKTFVPEPQRSRAESLIQNVRS